MGVNTRAAKAAKRQSFGRLLKPEKKACVETWLDDMPHNRGLEDAASAREASVEVYKDWLNWSKYHALSWLYTLDRLERRFRTAGLEYHKVPYSLRHSSTLLHGPKIDQGVLARLAQILETDRSRSQHSFFVPWMEINNTATEVLEEIESFQPIPEDAEFLQTVHHKFELALSRLAKPLRNLEAGLLWLEQSVADVAERSNIDGSYNLAMEYSREGSLFRQWIQTFLEIEQGYVASKSKYTEFYVNQVLDIGVESERYWSMLVENDD